jgi:hypothetical protein
METIEVVPYLLYYGKRLLTEKLLPRGVSPEEIRSLAIRSLNAVPGVYTAGTDLAPFEFENMLKFSTVTQLNGTGYRLSWERIRQILPKDYQADWLPIQTPA